MYVFGKHVDSVLVMVLLSPQMADVLKLVEKYHLSEEKTIMARVWEFNETIF